MNQASCPESPSGLAALGIHHRVISRVAVGAGIVAWARVEPTAVGVVLSTRTEALGFSETGIVARIDALNRGAVPVLIPAHLVLHGGRQTRVVERSVVIAAGANARVPVKCVERGRWGLRGEGADTHRLHGSEYSSVITRTALSALRYESYRSSGAYEADQASVWGHVDTELTRTSVESSTRSYGAYISTIKERQVEAARGVGLDAPVDANAILLIGAGWMSFEALPSPEALRDRVPTLLADLMEPTGRPPEVESVREIVAALWSEPLEPVAAVESTLGDVYALASRTISGEVILLDGALVHASVSMR